VQRFSLAVAFWTPYVFTLVLCGLALFGREAASPAFYSFPPVAFMVVAFAFGRLHGEPRRLEEKVQALRHRQTSDRLMIVAATCSCLSVTVNV
jgi:hypothetical protein